MNLETAPKSEVEVRIESGPDEENATVLRISGRVGFDNADRLRRVLLEELERLPKASVVHFDLREVDSTDSAAAGLLTLLEHDATAHDLVWGEPRLDATTNTLISLTEGHPKHDSELEKRYRGLFESFGEMILEGFADFKILLAFIGRVVISILWSFAHPFRIRWGEVAVLIQRTGAEALPIVALMSVLVGLVTAFSSAVQLRAFGANIYIANMVGIGMTREMGPLMAAILLTGRSGSAFAAEIGTMKISDEVDALTVMGVKPLNYLVMPRILAVMITLPLLTLFADVSGIIGGMIIAITGLDLTPLSFMQQLQKAIGVWDVFSGVLKALFFGILIAGTGCYRGMETEGGAIGVGSSTTSAVVSGIFLIVLADSVFVILFHFLGAG